VKPNANVTWLRTRSQPVPPPGFNPGTLVSTHQSARQQARQHDEFLKGPISVGHIKQAVGLSDTGRAALLLLAIHHQTSLRSSEWVTVPCELLDKFGLSRFDRRYLPALAKKGLVEVEKRGKGRTQFVRLIGKTPAAVPVSGVPQANTSPSGLRAAGEPEHDR
jgi:hypothetical protein